MAAASAATAHFSAQNHVPPPKLKGRMITSVSCSFTSLSTRKRAQRLIIIIRNSGSEVSAQTTETQVEEDSETPVEVPKGPPSLISALNVEKAIHGIAITDVDHYRRLGLGRGCSYDQVRLAYKNKVDELMNQGLEDQEELNNNLEILKESYAVLSSVEERRLYDWSLARTDKPDRYMWPYEVDVTRTLSPESPPPQEPEDVGPTRLVGYWTLGLLFLSFILFILFNG